MNDSSGTLEQARRLFAKGRYENAAEMCRNVVRQAPDMAEGHHLLGLTLVNLGELTRAAGCLTEAVILQPGNAVLHCDLGVVLRRMGQIDEAISIYQKAVKIDPEMIDGYYNLANAYQESGRLADAIEAYSQCLNIDAGHVNGRNNLGLALLSAGRAPEAAAHFRSLIVENDQAAFAHNNLGNALKAQNDLSGAIESYRRAIDRQAGYSDALSNLGVVLKDTGDLAGAISSHRRAIDANPRNLTAYTNLTSSFVHADQLDEAVDCGRRAVALVKEDQLGQRDVALSLLALATALAEKAELEAAIDCLVEAASLQPQDAMIHWTLALTYLRAGRMAQGWREYEWRWEKKDFTTPKQNFTQPLWDGGDLNGRNILLHAEQGLGDTIQFIRYAPLVRRRGGRVFVVCQPELKRLLQGAPGIDVLAASGEMVPMFDVHAPLLSLPNMLGTTLENIPGATPYLQAPANDQPLLPPSGKLKIGIVWRGSATHRNDHKRSLDLALFNPLFDLDGCDFFSLQMGAGRDQITQLGSGPPLHDLAGALIDFAATATAISELDLLISVDTAVAHLAGALGRPVWLLLLFAPDWRWMQDRDDSPWYPTMKLFRQKKPGDWAGVFEELSLELENMT